MVIFILPTVMARCVPSLRTEAYFNVFNFEIKMRILAYFIFNLFIFNITVQN